MGRIHEQLLEILVRHRTEGISEGEMRAMLGLGPQEQGQLGRRRRELSGSHHIERKRVGRVVKYFYLGPRRTPRGQGLVSSKTRAMVLHAAHGRCGMCGRSVHEHGVSLVVDHKLPRDWGGSNAPDNLWALCEECNQGKKNLFDSLDSPAVRGARGESSVHVRIGELLKASGGRPVPGHVIEFVADQDDWKKRLRELRYLGWEVKATRKRMQGGKTRSFYTLLRSAPWPSDPTARIRQYERARARRNARGRGEP